MDNKGRNIYHDSKHPWIQMERRHGAKIVGVAPSVTQNILYGGWGKECP